MTPRRICLHGVGVDAIDLPGALAWIDRTIKDGVRARIVTLNTTGLMMAEQVPFFRDYVARAELVVPDGQPLVWLARLFGDPLPCRVAGIDLVEELAEQAAAEGYSIYLLGAEDSTVATAAAELRQRHPALTIAGHHHGFLGDGAAEVAQAIGRSGAAILLVGMGAPRQEEFIERYWDELGVNIAIGVGGTFEVLARRLVRAPRWVQQLGLEWAFRMAQEPRRLAGRYMQTLAWLAARTAARLRQDRRVRHSTPRTPDAPPIGDTAAPGDHRGDPTSSASGPPIT